MNANTSNAVLDNYYRRLNLMNNQQSKEDTKQKEEIVYKFSNKGQGQLREAAIVEGKPCFQKYHCDEEKN